MHINTPIHTSTVTAMNTIVEIERSAEAVSLMINLARVLQFGDSMLPTGAFTFSHGLESAVERKVVTDAATLKDFVLTALEQASASDVIALQEAYDAALDGDLDRAAEIDRYLFNRKLNEEPRAMTVRTGKKLVEMAAKVVASATIVAWLERIVAGRTPGTYPVSLAVLFVETGLSLQDCVVVHQYSVATAILSAALRLMKVDHFDTQRILFALNQEIGANFVTSSKKTLSDISTFAPVVDVLAAVHVKAHVRLFMS